MKILLVEPDKVLGEAIAHVFESAKHKLTWKRNAQTALDALDDNIPDLIILEIQLGLHNGIEFLYEIRSYPEWQNVPVIVHTLNNKALDEQFSQAFAELDVRAVLYKPRTSTQNLLRVARQFAGIA